MLNHKKGRLSGLPLLSPGLHKNGIVEFDPHSVIVDTVVHLEAEGLDREFNKLSCEVREFENGKEIGDGFAELFEGVILDEAA